MTCVDRNIEVRKVRSGFVVFVGHQPENFSEMHAFSSAEDLTQWLDRWAFAQQDAENKPTHERP